MNTKEKIKYVLKNLQCKDKNKIKFALIGTHEDIGYGILGWFEYEIHARSLKKLVKEDNGICFIGIVESPEQVVFHEEIFKMLRNLSYNNFTKKELDQLIIDTYSKNNPTSKS